MLRTKMRDDLGFQLFVNGLLALVLILMASSSFITNILRRC